MCYVPLRCVIIYIVYKYKTTTIVLFDSQLFVDLQIYFIPLFIKTTNK
jgi:hypothetical protein